MALTDDGINVSMPVAPAYSMPFGGFGNMGGGLFGGNGDNWLGLLFLIALCNGGFGFGGFGGWGGMGMFGMMDGGFGLYPWLNNSQNINNGFRDQMLNTTVNGIQNAVTSGFGDVQLGIAGINQNVATSTAAVQNSLCNGFNSVNQGISNAQNALAQQMYSNQLADLERSFAAQTASTAGMTNIASQLANCCCENRAGLADVKYTIATENCADRAALSDGVRDIIANNTAQTQTILDKLCALELDGYKRENDQLRSQLQFANMQASQVAQTAELRTNNATVANQLVAELRSCPIPAQPVYGNQPIFTCGGNNSGCGCSNNF